MLDNLDQITFQIRKDVEQVLQINKELRVTIDEICQSIEIYYHKRKFCHFKYPIENNSSN